MPKPRRTVRPTYLNLAVPENIRAVLDLHLYSELEGRVPHGAYSKYLCQLIINDLFPEEQNESDTDSRSFSNNDVSGNSQNL